MRHVNTTRQKIITCQNHTEITISEEFNDGSFGKHSNLQYQHFHNMRTVHVSTFLCSRHVMMFDRKHSWCVCACFYVNLYAMYIYTWVYTLHINLCPLREIHSQFPTLCYFVTWVWRCQRTSHKCRNIHWLIYFATTRCHWPPGFMKAFEIIRHYCLWYLMPPKSSR